MKGLLIKEGYLIWKHGKFMAVLALIYCVMATFKSGYFFAGFSVVFLSMLPMTIMGLDERSKWDHYAVTMPYSRKEIVLTKYITTFSGAFAASVLFIISTMIKWYIEKAPGNYTDLFRNASLLLSLGLLYSTINLPIFFKFGVDKGRLWFILITVIIAAVIYACVSLIGGDLSKVGSFVMNLPFVVYIAVSLALMALSAVISFKIYENREL